MPTLSNGSSGFVLLLIGSGYSGRRCNGFLVGLGAGIVRTEQRIAKGANQDYFQKQLEKVLDRRVAPGVSGKLAKTDEVNARQMGLL